MIIYFDMSRKKWDDFSLLLHFYPKCTFCTGVDPFLSHPDCPHIIVFLHLGCQIGKYYSYIDFSDSYEYGLFSRVRFTFSGYSHPWFIIIFLNLA